MVEEKNDILAKNKTMITIENILESLESQKGLLNNSIKEIKLNSNLIDDNIENIEKIHTIIKNVIESNEQLVDDFKDISKNLKYYPTKTNIFIDEKKINKIRDLFEEELFKIEFETLVMKLKKSPGWRFFIDRTFYSINKFNFSCK